MTDQPQETAAPPIPSGPSWPLPLVAGLAVLVLAGLVVLFLFEPSRYALYPTCLFKQTTGYDCPGCGGLRAVHQLLHGEIRQAFQLNALSVIALPLFALFGLRAWMKTRRTRSANRRNSYVWIWLLLVLVVLFGVIRNLSIWPFGITPS